MKRTLSSLFIIVLIVAGFGCSRKQPQPNGGGVVKVHTVPKGTRLKLAFMPNAPAAFWKLAEQGLKKFEHDTGIHVDMIYPPTGKVEEQNRFIEDLISQGYHGLALSVIAPNDQIRELNKALKTMNVITMDSDAPLSKRLAFVGPKQYDAGLAAGREIAKLLPNGGQMAIFVGDLTADNSTERIRGITDATKDKNIQIIARKEDGTDVTLARSQVEDVITAYPEIDLVAGLWSYNGPAIAQALKASGKIGKIKAVVFDEEDGTLDGIEEGIIECTVVLTPFDYGYVSAKLLRDMAYKGQTALPEDKWIDTGFKVVTKDSLKAFRKRLAEYRKW